MRAGKGRRAARALAAARRAVLGLGVFVAGTALAQAPPPNWFFDGPEMESPALSPDGRRLAAITREPGQTAALSVYELGERLRARQVARFTAAHVVRFVWLDGERLMLEIAEGDPDENRARRLAPLHVVGADGSGLAVAGWHPGLAGVTAGSPRRAVTQTLRLDHMFEPSSVAVQFWSEADKGWKSPALEVPPNVRGWLMDPAGRPELVTTYRRGRVVHHLRRPGEGEGPPWTALADHDPLDPPWIPRFVDREGRLYVTRPAGADRAQVLARFDRAGAVPEADALISTPGFDVQPRFVIDEDTGELLGVRTVTDAEVTVWYHPRMKEWQAQVDGRLPGRINRLSCVRCLQADAVVLVTSWSDREPGEYWLLGGASGELRPLSRRRPLVDPAKMAVRSFQRVRARDGRGIPVWVTALEQTTARPRPAVVLVHGGPWMRGAEWEWEPVAQFLATRGYVVIEPEFRGSTGYGADHEHAGWKQWGQAMQDDLADALQWAVAEGIALRGQACLAGGSYGGYAALMGPLRHPGLWRCSAAWVAVTEPRLLYRSSWRSVLPAEMRSHVLPRTIGDRWNDSEMLRSISIVENAHRLDVPVLLAFGGLDGIVPIDHGRRLRSALRSSRHEVEYVVYENEGHGWVRAETWLDFAGRLERFLARHLR